MPVTALLRIDVSRRNLAQGHLRDDGVVSYKSAHIPEAKSELVVRSGHSVQANPHTVSEVRRILLLHLAEACPQGCVPVATTDRPPIAAGPTGKVRRAAKDAPRRR